MRHGKQPIDETEYDSEIEGEEGRGREREVTREKSSIT